MLKENIHNNNNNIISNRKEIEIKIRTKKKSKSINNRNMQKNAFKKKTKRLTLNEISNKIINDNFSLFQGVSDNKNESNLNLFTQKRITRIAINSKKRINIINIKRNKNNQKNIKQLKNIDNKENKENINMGNVNEAPHTSNNFYKAKKTKSLDNKKNIKKNEKWIVDKVFSENIKDKNKAKDNKKENIINDNNINLRNIKIENKKNSDLILSKLKVKHSFKNIEIIAKDKIKKQSHSHDINMKNKEIVNVDIQIKENKNNKDEYNLIIKEKNNENPENNIIVKNEEQIKKSFIQKEENNNDNEKKEEIKEIINNNSIHKGKNEIDKLNKTPEKDIPALKLSSEKNKSNNNCKDEDKSSKQKTPLLKLDSDSSSTSNSYPKGIITNSDYTESIYESEGLEVKGELLNKNKKTIFLNKIKRCLFKKDISSKDLSKVNLKINNSEEEDLKFKNSINIQKGKTQKLQNLHKINLKENISITESQINEYKPKLKSFVITKPGLNNNKIKKNQDSYLILENIFEQRFSIYGVFDGHGKNGHLISNLVSQFLSNYFTNKRIYYISKKNETEVSDTDSSISIKSDDININKAVLNEVFLEKNCFIENTIKKLVEKVNESNFNLELSGTTCVLLFILENKIICSNIGDSQCVLFYCSNEDRWTHEIISIIHKPDNPKEKERILEYGGLIHPYYDENGIFEGPDRVYVKNKTYPGLCLTRSIGDILGEEVGIISEPDIIIKNIDSTCKYIILASDGLWDMVKPYDASRIVNPYFKKGDPEGACNALLKRANKNWEKDGSDRDDITIIIIFIGEPNKE